MSKPTKARYGYKPIKRSKAAKKLHKAIDAALSDIDRDIAKRLTARLLEPPPPIGIHAPVSNKPYRPVGTRAACHE